MASYNVAPLEELVDQFARLPGIGKKTAQRLSFFVLGLPEGEAEKFADAIVEAHKKIHSCKICQNPGGSGQRNTYLHDSRNC